MLRYLPEITEWLSPQDHLAQLAVDVTERTPHVRQLLLGGRRHGFPGTQPVSLTAQNMEQLSSSHYVVAFKTDGIRALLSLLPHDNALYLTTRDLRTYRFHDCVQKHLLLPQAAPHLLYQLDGELLCYSTGNSTKFVYVPHDVLTFRAQCVEPLRFQDRLHCLEALVPETDHGVTAADGPLRVCKKSFLELSFLKVLQEEGYGAPSDGFIFQSMELPYRRGTCRELLKWKPAHRNSVDFCMAVEETEDPHCLRLLYTCSDGYVAHSCLVQCGSEADRRRCLSLRGKIVECVLDGSGRWRGVKQRKDKPHPNSQQTYHSILESIQDGVSWKQLVQSASP